MTRNGRTKDIYKGTFVCIQTLYASFVKKKMAVSYQLILSLSLDNLDSFWAKSEKLRSADKDN